MTGLSRVKLNSRSAKAILKSAGVRDELHAVAEPIAQAAEAVAEEYDGAFVEIQDYESDRAVVQVLFDHPKGASIEAKRAFLTGTARSVGLDVKGDE